MQGASGTYAVNGTDFLLSPTEGGWSTRNELGVDGGGHPVYSAVRQFELSWGLASPADVAQLIGAWELCASTGTVAFDLPQWGASEYIFKTYSGCTMREPEIGKYFNEYIKDVKVVILGIET